MKKRNAWMLPLIVLVYAALPVSCKSPTSSDVKKLTLTAGQAVDAAWDATSAAVSFGGAAGLSLAASDFEVTSGDASVSGVQVSGGTAQVTISFAVNESTTSTKQYVVGISAESAKVQGTGTVTVTQAAKGKAVLTAGSAVSVDAAETTADVTFSGASGLSLGEDDFIVSAGAAITGVNVDTDTVTVTITFEENGESEVKTYTVSINGESEVISGGAQVVVTQYGAGDERKTLVPTSGAESVQAAAGDTSAGVTFTGATGLGGSLSTDDFTVDNGAAVSNVQVADDTATVTITFSANTGVQEKTYHVGINAESEYARGTAQVTVTQGYTKKTLSAGQAVQAAAGDTAASVTFSGASGLVTGVAQNGEPVLTTDDFTVTGGATISMVNVVDDTATVTISFSANTSLSSTNSYTVGINPSSLLIQGSATVVVTQAAKVPDNIYYVSWSGGSDDNNGKTEQTAWKTIAKVNSHGAFQPGDAILFKRGDTWTWDNTSMTGVPNVNPGGATGTAFLAPAGSGEQGNPVMIGAYGTGAKPKIEGKGLVDDIILLHNQQYWEIGNLELTNKVDGWTNPTSQTSAQGELIAGKDLRGIHISGNNGTVLHGFHLHDLYIHDVTGQLNWIGGAAYINSPAPEAVSPGVTNKTGWEQSKRTGGILVEGLQNTSPTTFDTITVEDNSFEFNSFGAFTVKQYHGGSNGPKWAMPSENNNYPYYNDNFKPHTNIIVRRNWIDQTGWYHGDGIYLTSVMGALVEGNVVKNPGVCGIEMYYSGKITVQNNEVYGSTSKGGGSDTNGIDPDVRTFDIIVQYNYVHDCGDGFLICGARSAILRHNVLYNNNKIYVRDVTDRGIIQVYNNVFWNNRAPLSGTQVKFTGWTTSNSNSERWEFYNNIFYNEYAGLTSSFLQNSNNNYSNNLYYGIGVTPPATQIDPGAVAANPLFAAPKNFVTTAASVAERQTNFDFLRPGPGSPLINQGIAYAESALIDMDIHGNGSDVNGLDFAGASTTNNARDIGLFAADFNGLAGIVKGDDGSVVEGAAVTVNGGSDTTTDAEGVYQIAGVTVGGPCTLSITAEGYEEYTEAISVANADAVPWHPVTLTTGEPVYRDITGTVTTGGTTPLEGATVTISKGQVSIQATTGPDGTYTLLNVPSGTGYTITASLEDYDSWSEHDIAVPRAGEIAPVDFNLIESAHVYYDEPFDTLDDWTQVKKNAGDTIEIIADPDNGENHLLHINKTSSGSSGNALGIYNKTFAGAQGVFTLETRMKRSVSDNVARQVQIYTYNQGQFVNGDGSGSMANIIFDQGYIKTHNASTASSNVMAYAAETWYDIALRIDTATYKFDFYVDGVKQVNQAGFRTTKTQMDIFNIAAGNSGSAPGHLWVDYIKVYQGEPKFPIISVQQITLDESDISIEVGASDTLTATVDPLDAPQGLHWVSGDNEIATVSPTTGATVTVTGVAEGVTTITAISDSDGSKYASATVHVTYTPVESIVLDQESLTLDMSVTTSGTLTATVNPAGATVKTVSWRSTNTAVATVEGNGLTVTINAVGPGTADIYATSNDGEEQYAQFDYCTVTVNAGG
jgi:parallel beta-helix repeat protein